MGVPAMPMMMAGPRGPGLVYKSSSVITLAATNNIPNDVIAGDLLIMVDAGGGPFSPPSALAPSGWTEMGSTTVGKTRVQSRYKIAAGGDAGASIATLGSLGGTSMIIAFTPRKPILTLTASSVNQQASTGNPSAQTITAGGQTGPMIGVGFYVANAAVDPRTFTIGGVDAKDQELQSITGDTYTAWKIFEKAGSDINVDMDDEGDQHLHSWWVKVATW